MASRLLFDENLSPRLTKVVADLFPESEHIRDPATAQLTLRRG